MANAFLGSKVSVLLHSGIQLEGTVSELEPSTQQMTLKNVTFNIFGYPPHYTPIYGVVGKEIKDLQILAAASPQLQQQQPTASTNDTHKYTKSLNNHVLEQVPPYNIVQDKTLVTPTNSISKTRRSRQQQQQSSSSYNYNNNNNRRNNVDGWAGEDVNVFIEEEFDFEKNLGMFDKAKEFAKIRESDETAPEELLVSFNRLPPKKKTINLLPTENVLDHQLTAAYHHRSSSFSSSSNGQIVNSNSNSGDESDNESLTPDEYAQKRKPRLSKKKQSTTTTIIEKQVKIVTSPGGMRCPTVTCSQMVQVKDKCITVFGQFLELAIENAGRGSSHVIFQRILEKHNKHVVMLIGNNKIGASALVAARHLINRGCSVTCHSINTNYTTRENDNNGFSFHKYTEMAKQSGVNYIDSTDDLIVGQYDLVVDAILGEKTDAKKSVGLNQLLICKAILWIDLNSKSHDGAPVLSIDFPSGVDCIPSIELLGSIDKKIFDQDCRMYNFRVKPQWTVCLGLPQVGCTSTHVTGELFLIDVGIPSVCWKKVSVNGNTIPWGADFLVPLKYNPA